MPPRTCLAAACATAIAAAACASTDGGPTIGAKTTALTSGSTSSETDAVVAIALVEAGLAALDCSGTLVAPRLVLTARSCIATAGAGGSFEDDAPAAFAIYAGPDANARIVAGAPASASVRQLFVPATKALHPDVALLALDRDVAGTVATLRLARPAQASEALTLAGYGMTEQNELPLRLQRSGLTVTAVGPSAGLQSGQFATTESLCTGDFGGPAFVSTSNALVGVATPLVGAASSPAGGRCLGGGARVVFTDLAAAKDTITRAFKAIGATPKLEAGAGDADTSNDDAENHATAKRAKGDRNEDREVVSEGDAPLEDFPVASAGCSSTCARGSPSSAAWLLLIAAVARWRRRGARGEASARRPIFGEDAAPRRH